MLSCRDFRKSPLSIYIPAVPLFIIPKCSQRTIKTKLQDSGISYKTIALGCIAICAPDNAILHCSLWPFWELKRKKDIPFVLIRKDVPLLQEDDGITGIGAFVRWVWCPSCSDVNCTCYAIERYLRSVITSPYCREKRFITSLAEEVIFLVCVCLFVCLSAVCLWATLLKRLWTDCNEILWKGWGW